MKRFSQGDIGTMYALVREWGLNRVVGLLATVCGLAADKRRDSGELKEARAWAKYADRLGELAIEIGRERR